jgi:predicted CXXCH cytochrome family protein
MKTMKTKQLQRGILMIMGVALMSWTPRAQQQDLSLIELGPSCMTSECHTDLRELTFNHGPLNLGQCVPCHEPVGNRHVFAERERSGPQMCLTCHEQPAPQAHVHAPFAADCMACHDPHGGENRLFVKGGLGAEGCMQCHTDVRAGLSMLHGPVGLGECLVCHTAHQSEEPALLTMPRSQLCNGCHVDVAQQLQGAVSVHEPVAQDCAGCHNAHGGNEPFFLTASPMNLCRSCHEDFMADVAKFEFQHKPMAEGKACMECHHAHASTQEQLLKGNNMSLCLSCHDTTIQTDHGMLPNVKAQLEAAEFLHGPLREDNCIACHDAHGSNHANILDLEFPDSFYTAWQPEKYDLCFKCHDKQIALDAMSDVTGFRNGGENLHYLHVNREKGRSCRACHHEHASMQPNHVRSEVPFGNWMMKVEFKKTETGGTCTTGCHQPYQYDREAPVANEVVAVR